jgi:hypothetical protein
VTPCLLLQDRPIDVTPSWVLCHQDVLTQVLLDKVFLPGFDAARTLQIRETALAIQLERARTRPEFTDPGTGRSADLANAILEPARTLFGTGTQPGRVRRVQDFLREHRFAGIAPWDFVIAFYVGGGWGGSLEQLRDLVYAGSVTGAARAALQQLDSDRANTSPFDALKAFFGRVRVEDLEPAVVPTTIAQGLRDQGMVDGIVDALLQLHVLEQSPDDLGLRAAVQAAWDTLRGPAAAPALTPPVGAGDVVAAQAAAADLEAQATAQVAFNQLRCHIQENLLHYAHAVWGREDADQRLLRLQGRGLLSSLIGNEILGFLGDRTAYPIVDPDAVRRFLGALDAEKVRGDFDKEADRPVLVTHPTPGTVVETILGECDACEEYIRDSREIDLRRQRGLAGQAEAEARRRRMRLDASPPDLSDPTEHGRVVVNVDGQTDNTGGDGQ